MKRFCKDLKDHATKIIDFNPIQPGLFGAPQAWGGGGFPPPYQLWIGL